MYKHTMYIIKYLLKYMLHINVVNKGIPSSIEHNYMNKYSTVVFPFSEI